MTKLNKDYIIYNLEEAKSEIDTILRSINAHPGYMEDDFRPVMQHIYHHINTAWNSRFTTRKETHEYTQPDFFKWRQFPTDIDMN